jgi:CPA2 family monovalent cation:H+ antiporter-2
MPHHSPLIATITAGFVLAFLLGALANRLRIPTLVGYMVAGILVGPFTPGFVADQRMAAELAEIGVILLMFGVGLHFSFKDLLLVKGIAIPGAVAQMTVATLIGMALARFAGWSAGAGIVFGLSLAVASTVVLVRALQEHRLMETERGHIALGWLVVQDLAMVLALVLVPALASLGGGSVEPGAQTSEVSFREVIAVIGLTVGKVLAFAALMLLFGRRFIPWVLHYVAHTGSRELFRLAVLAIALGVAYSASTYFGISLALGAFFAGTMLHESPLSQRAAEESLPLRDAFAVLFFVSVGMLFDPSIILREPFLFVGVLLIVLVVNPASAYFLMTLFKRPKHSAMTIAASLAQIGEFSFILTGMAVVLGLLQQEARDLILAVAIVSIFANPVLFRQLEKMRPRKPAEAVQPSPQAPPEANSDAEVVELVPTKLSDHAVIVGYGRVGSVVGEGLMKESHPFLVIEDRTETVEALRKRKIEVLVANAVQTETLAAANIAGARWLFVAIPDGFEAGQVVEQARRINPDIAIIARAHSDAEVEHLINMGASFTIMGEREIAMGMLEFALGRPHAQPDEHNDRMPSGIGTLKA